MQWVNEYLTLTAYEQNNKGTPADGIDDKKNEVVVVPANEEKN